MLDVAKRDELIQSFDDKRLRTLFAELLEDIDGLTRLDIHRSQQIRDIVDSLRLIRESMSLANRRLDALEVEMRELELVERA